MNAINIYCDESAHLEHDQLPLMGLGALWCPREKTHESAVRIREIKLRYGLPASFEIKWGKVSPARVAFYQDVLDYFFDDDDLHFRAVLANKIGLDHGAFAQDHDTWYYKMYFLLLGALLAPSSCYRIYVDIKDTKSQRKVVKLHEVLCNSLYDFDRRIIERIQQVRSHEVEHIQLADFLLGCVQYANRSTQEGPAKAALVARMRRRSGYTLTKRTLLRESKVNIMRWDPREVPR